MNQIKTLRQATGMTQVELAARVGVSQAAVANWEKGTADPTVANVLALAKILHCSTDEILGLRPA